MSLITQLLMAVIGGVMSFFLLPLLVGAVSPPAGERVARHYLGMGLNLLGAGAIVLREHGGTSLKRLSFDSRIGRHKADLGGATKYFGDPAGCMHSWSGKRFGIADEKRGVIIDPMNADFGREFSRLKREEKWTVESKGVEYRKKWFNFKPGHTTVALEQARSIIQGAADPLSVERAYNIMDVALTLPGSTWLRDNFDRVTATGSGFVLVWLASELGASVGDGSGDAVSAASEILYLLPGVVG